MSASAQRIEAVIKLCAEATAAAQKAANGGHRLTGNHNYATNFQDAVIALTPARDEAARILSAGAVPQGDVKDFLESVDAVASSDTPIRDRRQALRRLTLVGRGTIVPALRRSDEPEMPLTQDVLPLAVVDKTRGYIVSVVVQANGNYERGWYDAASVMIRKLVEILIIEVYEAASRANAIKNANGDFLMLGDLITTILGDPAWNLGRETKAVLPKVKQLGDRGAHNRRYVATKPDVEKVIPGLRAAADDLLHLAKLK